AKINSCLQVILAIAWRFFLKNSALPYLDYGARFYHPLSSRWTTMDLLAEKYYSVSPYAFCSNNPVNFAIKREQNELAHFAECEQRKARRGLTLWIGMGSSRCWLIWSAA
ncbi:MAG: hypothetical protein K2H95_00890, partial [Bacteroidales bacterium]|nr:hypothetical protein [Bacteroidales bacterium]